MIDNEIMDVKCHASVDGFFHEIVTDALGAVRVEATEPTEWYLVSLLGDFTRARLPDQPLGVMLAESRAALPGDRLKTLKEVGDTSLYVAGFFTESLAKKLVDAEYYIGLGSTAYAELAGRLGGSLTEVYGELASKFPSFVEVLGEVRRRVDFAGADVVKLYEQWIERRDEWIERKLRNFGVLVDVDGKPIH